LLPLAFHILLHATVSAMDYTPNIVSKGVFSLYLAFMSSKKVLENFSQGSLKVLDFFQ